MSERPIERAVRIVASENPDIRGGQSKLARAIGVSQQRVWNWLHRDQAVPARYCKDIEAATGGRVTAEELRPDVFGKPRGGGKGNPPSTDAPAA